jgi:hypothetical protein
LASLGSARHEIDDLVQETAARALEHRVPFDSAADLRRWCFVVARRLLIDEIRAQRRRAPLETAAADADPVSAAELSRVEDRALLRHVAASWHTLKAADKAALKTVTTVPAQSDRAEQNRRNVARHRARGRLRALVGPLAAASGLFPSLRRLQPRPTPVLSGVPVLAAMAVSVGIAASPTVIAPAQQQFPVVVTSPLSDASAPGGTATSSPSETSPPSAQVDSSNATSSGTATGPVEPRPIASVRPLPGAGLTVSRRAAREAEPVLCLHGTLTLCLPAVATAAGSPPPTPGLHPGPEPGTAAGQTTRRERGGSELTRAPTAP